MLFSQSPVDPPGKATIGGTCASVQTFAFCKGFTASGSLDPHKQRHELTKGLCGTRLADSAKTELLWISLMKPGASALLSKLRQPFTQEKLGITTKRLKVYLPRMFEIRNEEFLKI